MARLLVPLILLLIQSACTQAPIREPVRPTPRAEVPAPPPPPEHKVYTRPDTAPAPAYHGHGGSRSDEGGSTGTGSPAVLALLTEADRQLAAGQSESAASALERAIRIKPKSAELWHKLAKVRLQQHQPLPAENMAKKSNVLAHGDKDLTRRNWAIIAEARRQRGDEQGAREAESRSAP